MSAKVQVSVEEYLRTSYDNPDREYVDGEIVERPMPNNAHSYLQGRLIEIFYEIRKLHPLYALPELRHGVTPTRYRIPDLAVFVGRPVGDYPTSPPLIAIEILSPDERHSELMQKLREYRDWGVAHVWVIDPALRSFAVYGATGLSEVAAFHLSEYGVTITTAEVFDEL